jgi:hypothetical protein
MDERTTAGAQAAPANSVLSPVQRDSQSGALYGQSAWWHKQYQYDETDEITGARPSRHGDFLSRSVGRA